MSYVFPAIRGRMGSTEYYQASVAARDLAAIAITAGELPEWQDWSIFERFQRDLAWRRVQHEIVPYLTRTGDRFFGSLIVLVFESDRFQFEPLPSMVKSLPAPYASVSSQIGFLSIAGGKLVVLDGQHRLAALRSVVTAGDELSGKHRDGIGSDQMCVIFVNHESFEKTRRIFNKVNRYAKPTSPADNIVTSEDDGYAIIARWLVESTPPLGLRGPRPPFGERVDRFGEPLIEWRSTQLKSQDHKITTLHALYQTVQIILEANGIHQLDEKYRVSRPSDVELSTAYQVAADWWNITLCNVSALASAMGNPWTIPDQRQYRERNSLLFRPVGLIAFFRGLQLAVSYGLTVEEATRRAGRMKWRASARMWRNTVIFANGRINARESGIRIAGRLAAYRLAKDLMTGDQIDLLERDLQEATGYTYPLRKSMAVTP